jgi:hypothetical protein
MLLKTRGNRLLNSDHVIYWSIITNKNKDTGKVKNPKWFIGYETIVEPDVQPLTGQGYDTDIEAIEALMELQDLLNNPNSYDEAKEQMGKLLVPVTNLAGFKDFVRK